MRDRRVQGIAIVLLGAFLLGADECAPPMVWPASGSIVSTYGTAPPGSGGLKPIDGVDIRPGGLSDGLVYASCGGVVSKVVTDSVCGLAIVLAHGDGYATQYCHLAAAYVQPGWSIVRGQVIGEIGRSGGASAEMLFFRVLDGQRSLDLGSAVPPVGNGVSAGSQLPSFGFRAGIDCG